jgi:flagellar FliL protein
MSDQKPEGKSQPTTNTPPPKGKLVPVLLVVNSALMAGVLGMMLLKPAGGGAAAKEGASHGARRDEHAEERRDDHGKEGALAVGPTIKMPDFVVHLRNPEAERYARLAVELELTGEPDKEKVTLYMPRLRDAFIAYFTDRTTEELTGSEALARTKQELFKKVEELVPGRRVRALYITDFVVQ